MASPAFLRFAVERLINGAADEAERDALREAVASGEIVFATGERAVAVGGSVQGAIITGDNNLVLSLDDTNIEILKRTLSDLFSARALGVQPPLDLAVLDLNEQNRFVYGARRVPFIGRATDIGACDDFLKSEGLFRWWLLLGSGGSGKSRLALELCLKEQKNWNAGFLPHKHGFDGWSIWQPVKPTLIVIDYAGERGNDVRDLIVALAGRRNLAFPVRVLLLEREKDGTWWRQIMRGGQEWALIEGAQFGEPRQLSPLNSDDLWHAMSVVFGDRKSEFDDRRDGILGKLHEIDPRGRPLFAALAADALLHGGDIFRWDRKVLVRDLLTREDRRRWEPAGVGEDDPHRMLLALSTAIGGLRYGDLNRPEVIRLVSGIQFRPRVFQILTGRAVVEGQGSSGEDAALPVLEPDIIGELFVLEHLASRSEAFDDFRRAAWSLDYERFANFLDRALRDFDVHPTIKSLLEPTDGASQEGLAWAQVAPHVVMRMVESGDGVGALTTLERLFARTNRVVRPDSLAAVAIAVAEHFIEKGDGSVAQSIHSKIAALATDYLQFVALAAAQVSIAFKLVSHFGETKQYASIPPLYRSVAELMAVREALIAELSQVKYPEAKDESVHGLIVRTGGPPLQLQILKEAAPDLRLNCARLAVNALRWIGISGDLSAAQKIFDEISRLAAAHFREIGLKEAEASAAVNLALHYGERDCLEDAARLLDRLRQYANAADASDNILSSFAKAVVNIVQAYERAGRLESAGTIYKALAERAAAHGTHDELRSYQAMALEMLVQGTCLAGDLTTGGGWYREIVALAKQHPSERALRKPLIYASQRFLISLCEAKRSSEAYEVYRSCVGMSAASQEEMAELGRVLVTSLYRTGDFAFIAEVLPAVAAQTEIDDGSLHDRRLALLLEVEHKLALGGEVEPACKAYGDLSALVGSRKEGGASILAQGLSSLVLGACLTGDASAAKQFYQDLRLLVARWGKAIDLSKWRVLAARNMLILAEKTDDTVGAASYYDDLRAAGAPSDVDSRRDVAGVTLRAQLLVIKAGNFDKAATICADLAALAGGEANDRKITQLLGRATYNLVSMYCTQRDFQCAEAARRDLATLVASHDDNADLLESYAAATFNVLTNSAAANNLILATECYATLRSLAERHPEAGPLRVRQAEGAHDLIWYMLQSSDLAGAERTYRELTRLSRGDSGVQIQICAARTAFNFMHSAVAREGASAARQFCDDVVTVVGANLDQPELRTVLTKAIALMIIIYMVAQDGEALARMTNELEHAPYRDEVRGLVNEQLRQMGAPVRF